MGIKVVEYGPFGCQIDRGVIENINEIPEGFVAVRVDVGDGIVVYIDPMRDVIIGEKTVERG
jgi:hypothetical protein